MKIDRQIGILTLLLQQDRLTAPELARRFEVSRRTINRDIEDLCKAGVPIAAAQGYGGGLSIVEGYKIDKSFLTRDELQAVLAGLRGMDSVSETALLAGLRDKLGRRGAAAEDIVVIDLASHYHAALVPKLEALKGAIRARRVVRFRYTSEKGESRRQIEPYRLVFQWSSWYVFGYCLDREDFRLFKLNRLWDLEASDQTFAPRDIPEGALDFGGYFASGRYCLKALFHPGAGHRLIDEYGVGSYTAQPGGELLFEWEFASYEHMREWVLSFGDQVRVLEPPELQADRKRQARHILDQ